MCCLCILRPYAARLWKCIRRCREIRLFSPLFFFFFSSFCTASYMWWFYRNLSAFTYRRWKYPWERAENNGLCSFRSVSVFFLLSFWLFPFFPTGIGTAFISCLSLYISVFSFIFSVFSFYWDAFSFSLRFFKKINEEICGKDKKKNWKK